MNSILEHKQFVASQILKSFSNEIEKAFPIGTIRNWGGFDYKKVSDTEWVKVVNSKSVANSTILKRLKEDVKDLEYKRDFVTFQEKQKRAREIGTPTESMKFRVLWESKFSHEIQYVNQVKEINNEIANILGEISELSITIKKPTKAKKEITTKDDLFKNLGLSLLNNFGNFLIKDDNGEYIRRRLSAKEALGEQVTSSNYFLHTFAEFDEIMQDSWTMGEDKVHRKYTDAVAEFNKMKDSGKYEYTHSPKSDSEYLVDNKNNTVYRLANHWGKCASCDWFVKPKGKTTSLAAQGTYILAKCNFRDFKRKETSDNLFENPKYVEASISAVEEVLKRIKTHIDNGVVFSKGAKNELRNAWDVCKSQMHRVSNEMKQSVDKLEKEYNELFAI